MLLRCRPRILAKAWVFLQQQTCLIHRGNPGQRALLHKTDSSQLWLPDDYRLCLRQHQSRREAFKCSNHKSSTLTFGVQTKTTLFIILILFRNCQPPHLHLPSFTVIFNEEHLRGVEALLHSRGRQSPHFCSCFQRHHDIRNHSVLRFNRSSGLPLNNYPVLM